VDKFIGYESLEKEHPIVSCGLSGILALLFKRTCMRSIPLGGDLQNAVVFVSV
jgi:hypothetical protein